jgi:putative pyruvate formate lyase activating enzyme
MDKSMEIRSGPLSGIFLELQDKGAHNVNLVTPTPHIRAIREALTAVRGKLHIPVVWNTSSYETAQALQLLDGLVDVYLPDLKYFSHESSLRYSGVPDYWPTASSAVLEMARQAGETVFDSSGLIQKGLIIRHLVLPGLRKESMQILDWIHENLPETTYVSLLAQYFPEHRAREFPEINRRITKFEYDSVVDHFLKIGLQNGYQQKRVSAVKDYVPEF